MSDTDESYESSDNELVEPLLRENKRLRWKLAKYQKKNSILKDVLAEKDVKMNKLEKKDDERDELLSKQEDTIRNLIRQMTEQTSEMNFIAEKLKEGTEEGPSSENNGEVASLKATIDIQSRRNNELSNELQEERKKREKAETDIDMFKFNLSECEREIEQLREQKDKLRLDLQRMKRDADVSKRLLSDVKLQLKNAKGEQENAQTKAEEQKKEAVDVKSQMEKERRMVSKLKEDHDKMKEKFDDYRRGYDEIKTKCDQTKREFEEKKEELRVKSHQYSRQNRHFKDLERKYRELTEMHNRMKDRMEEKDNEMQEKENLLKEVQERVWLKDKVMNDFKTNAQEANERANELDKSLEEKEEDSQTKDEKIAHLMRLVKEMKAELVKNNVDGIRQELHSKETLIEELKATLDAAKKEVETKEQELEYLKKASEDLQFISSNLEEKEYDVTQLEALNSDLKTQIRFKDDQLEGLQKTAEEQKMLLESQMYDLEGYERQVTEKNNILQDLKDQIDGYCKNIDQKDKEIKRHKREKEDVKKDVEWKEKKVDGMEEDIALQRKQLALMEKEIRMRENEVEERESSMLTEMAGMRATLAEKDAKIEGLTSDLMEVKDYIEEEAKQVEEKNKEMEELKDELKKEKDLNKTNDPKSIRELARKQHHADLMKEKRRHEQEIKKLKQKTVAAEEKLKEEQIQMEELQKQHAALSKKSTEGKDKHEEEMNYLKEKLDSQRKARLDDKKKTDDVEMKFWSEEEKYVEQIRAIELSRQKLKVENESLREDVEMFGGIREQLDEKIREVEELKIELAEMATAKKEDKEMMKKLILEGEEVIHMYQNEVQQLKNKLMNEPSINMQEGVSESVEEMRRLIELEYNIGKEEKGFDTKINGDIDQECLKIIGKRDSRIDKRGENVLPNKKQQNVWKYAWYSLLLILVSVPVLSSQFPYHVVMTSGLLYVFTLGFLIWKDMERRRKLFKPGGASSDVLSKAVSDIYEENQNLRKTVEQLIVRVASESVEKNELARKVGTGGGNLGRDAALNKELTKQLEEKTRMIEAFQEIRKELTGEGKQLRAKQRANEGALQQKDKVIKKLEQKFQDVVEGEGVDISTEKILQEIRDDDERKEMKKNEALERFQELAMAVVGNTRHEKILGISVSVGFIFGVLFLLVCKQPMLLGSSALAVLATTMALVFALVVKSRNKMAELAEELNEEAARSLESTKEIQELSTLVEKHVEVVTKQKRAISALERQLKAEHQRNENQKLIIAKLTWTIQEGKDIENLLGRSGTYRGQDKKALEHALKTMAEDHVKEKIDLFKSMRAHLAEDDVDNEEKRWILEDLKQATKDITKSLPCVPGTTCSLAEYKGVWKLAAVFIICLVAFLWLFYGKYYAVSILPLMICAAFVIFTKKTGAKYETSCDVSRRCVVMDVLFICISIATVSFAHSNGYLQEMAFLIILVLGAIRVAVKKLGMKDASRITERKCEEIEELRERVKEEVRRQARMSEQMETWKRLLEVERSYNKESDDVISEVREMEQKTHREVRREIEKMKKEKKERMRHVEELEKELNKSTLHCSKQRRQMEELNRVIKELEKRQKKGSREIDVLKELNKYEKDELHVALDEEKKAKEEILKNVEKEKEKVKHEVSGKLSTERKELQEKLSEIQTKLDEERKIAKEFLDQVDSELQKNERMNGEIDIMKGQMEQERETREDLRNRFKEINQIRQDREKVFLDQIEELQNQITKLKKTVEKLTQELEDNVDHSKKEKSKTLYDIQEKQLSELQNRLTMATKTTEDLRQQEKVSMKELEDSRGRQGKLLKDLSKLQDKSGQDHRTIQKKQKEVKELKTFLEKLKRDNAKLERKFEASSLESSMTTMVFLEEVLKEDDKGRKKEDDKGKKKEDEREEEQIGIDDAQETNRSEDLIDDCVENDEIDHRDEDEPEEQVTRGVPADFNSKDTQGIIYWLGTSGGTSAWKNPGEEGIVRITRSSYGHGKASDIAERKPSWCSTSNKTNQWWKIDFGDKRAVLPAAYTLQHGWSGVSGALRNWVLEGSRDGKVWLTLQNHVDDETLTKGYAAATWKINDINTPYRYLRVRQTGKNSAGKDSLRLCGFEVYGQLVLND